MPLVCAQMLVVSAKMPVVRAKMPLVSAEVLVVSDTFKSYYSVGKYVLYSGMYCIVV